MGWAEPPVSWKEVMVGEKNVSFPRPPCQALVRCPLNSICPKPQRSCKVTARDPMRLCPITSERRCHQAEGRCHCPHSIIFLKKGTLSTAILRQWLLRGVPIEGEWGRKGAELLLWSLGMVGHHSVGCQEESALSKPPWAPPVLTDASLPAFSSPKSLP